MFAVVLNHKEGPDAPVLSYVSGALLACLVFAVALALANLAYRLTGRSSRVGNGVLASLLIGVFVADAAWSFRRHRDALRQTEKRAALDSLKRQNDGFRRRSLETLDADGTMTPLSAEETDDRIRAMREAADRASAEEAILLRASAQITERLAQAALPFNEANRAFAEQGGLDPATLDSKDAIRSRMGLVDEVAAANKAFETAIRDSVVELGKMLEQEGYPEAERDRVLAGYSPEGRFGYVFQLRAIQSDFATAAQLYLKHLDAFWGSWELSEGGDVTFNNEQSQSEFLGLWARVEELAEHEREVLRKLATSPEPPR